MLLIHDLYKELGWWFWLATVPFLLLYVLTDQSSAIYIAMGLTMVQFCYYLYRDADITSFPVQVRIGYMILLGAGLYEPLFFIHWIQILGTSAMILFGYCPLARILSLFSWNRQQALDWDYVIKAFFSPPVSGSILEKHVDACR